VWPRALRGRRGRMGFYGEKTYSSAVAIARNLVPSFLGWQSGGGAVADRELSRRAERSSSCSTCKALVDRGAGSPKLSERGYPGPGADSWTGTLSEQSHRSSAEQNKADGRGAWLEDGEGAWSRSRSESAGEGRRNQYRKTRGNQLAQSLYRDPLTRYGCRCRCRWRVECHPTRRNRRGNVVFKCNSLRVDAPSALDHCPLLVVGASLC
jgi:hypothetical protein